MTNEQFDERLAAYSRTLQDALTTEYQEIFLVTPGSASSAPACRWRCRKGRESGPDLMPE